MEIRIETIEELIRITAGLVREAVEFKAYKSGGEWIIELTGGF